MKALTLIKTAAISSLVFVSAHSFACRDNVVLVHGNGGGSEDWDNTYDELINRGYQANEIFIPEWGSSFPTNNNHSGSEEYPVRDAINDAVSTSCTGKIDVISHSMGVTLGAQQIIKEGQVSNVDAFVGIAGAYRGLMSCGQYPFNVWSPTCGSQGLSVSSPFLDWLYGKEIADRVYSMKSWVDQIVCGTGSCLIYGVHSSSIAVEDASYDFAYGHMGLQQYTAVEQVDLIQ